tara:strand:+ start:842 stop:1222 length:381 start_codon:yes stop_codon:yes gene_type:complete
MKKVTIVITVILGIIVMLYGGLHLFGKMIYNTQSCERYNIDNIELRTGVDIPEITATDCECKNHEKISKFSIDTNKVDLEDYISKNDFTLVDGLYIKENDNKNSKYKVAFDKKTAELTVNLRYKNN